MSKNRSKARFWTTLTAINLMMLVYPVCMLLGADSQEATFMGIVVLTGVVLVVAIADIVSVLLAYSPTF